MKNIRSFVVSLAIGLSSSVALAQDQGYLGGHPPKVASPTAQKLIAQSQTMNGSDWTPEEYWRGIDRVDSHGQPCWLLLSVREGKDLAVRLPTRAERAEPAWWEKNAQRIAELKAQGKPNLVRDVLVPHVGKAFLRGVLEKLHRYQPTLNDDRVPPGYTVECSIYDLAGAMYAGSGTGYPDGYMPAGFPQVVSKDIAWVRTYGFARNGFLFIKVIYEKTEWHSVWLCGNGMRRAKFVNGYIANGAVPFTFPTPTSVPTYLPPPAGAGAKARAEANAGVIVNINQGTYIPLVLNEGQTVRGYSNQEMMGSIFFFPRSQIISPPPNGGNNGLPLLPPPGGSYPYFQGPNRPEFDYNVIFGGNGNSGPPWWNGNNGNTGNNTTGNGNGFGPPPWQNGGHLP